MPGKCDCDLCRRGRKWDEIIDRTAFSSPEDKEFVVDLVENHLCEVEEELSCQYAILNGDWPSAVERLEMALDTAKKKRADKRSQPVHCDRPPTAPCNREFCLFPTACGYLIIEKYEEGTTCQNSPISE